MVPPIALRPGISLGPFHNASDLKAFEISSWHKILFRIKWDDSVLYVWWSWYCHVTAVPVITSVVVIRKATRQLPRVLIEWVAKLMHYIYLKWISKRFCMGCEMIVLPRMQNNLTTTQIIIIVTSITHYIYVSVAIKHLSKCHAIQNTFKHTTK